ncbi:MAG: SDR family oxidoreductase [Hyphomicrobiales bacterium]|nr:MAG: SDR family oxidoreductase [Hyphomicrobiales bacterium]
MEIRNSTVLVTGAGRGLGAAYVELALSRGAKKVYAGARTPKATGQASVVPIKLDVGSAEDIASAAALARDVDIVINNAGIALPAGVATPEGEDALRRQLETNVFGVLRVSQAFAPILARNGGGALVNMLSALSWINAPALSGYSASKAAAWGITNALRNELRGQGTLVVGVHAGFIDTDMAKGFPGPKSSPADVARQVFDAIEAGQEEVLADEVSRRLKAGLSAGAYLQPVGGASS